MTSINAIRFDSFKGAMVCDECRGWNPEEMRIYSADKIKPVIPDEIRDRYGLVACYGNTGSSSTGDEIKQKIRERVQKEFDDARERLGRPPETFLTIRDLAYLAYDEQCKMKHRHVDEHMVSHYGFNTRDFCRGSYTIDDTTQPGGKRKIEIKDKDVQKEILEALTWKNRGQTNRGVFVNAGLLAGYEPREGFRIYHTSLIEFICEPVQFLFLAEGSGLDATDLLMSEYMGRKSLPERRDVIDRVEGIMALICSVNTASRHNIGVGGYFNIILVDGREKDPASMMRCINDHRAKLVTQIADAYTQNLVSRRLAFKLVEDVLYNKAGFQETRQAFFEGCKEPEILRRHLRGYRIASPKGPARLGIFLP